MSGTMQGKIKWFRQDKGYGFIEIPDGKDVFVHVSQLSEEFKEGDEVTFEIKEGKKGPVATDVKRAS